MALLVEAACLDAAVISKGLSMTLSNTTESGPAGLYSVWHVVAENQPPEARGSPEVPHSIELENFLLRTLVRWPV